MGPRWAVIVALLVILVSGCTQAGMIVKREAQNHTPEEAYVNFSGNDITDESSSKDPCEDITCPDSVTICPDGHKSRCSNTCSGGVCPICMPSCYGHDPCEGVVCNDSMTECPDGFEAVCSNTCDDGECTDCEPDCSGHQKEQGTCNIECGTCEIENLPKCRCDKVVPCDGNGICEPGEYPSSADCPDCSDGDNCTEDLYDYNISSCYHEAIVPCCGNGVCEVTENHTVCPEDCD
ncbi:MAG: hypothetical protein DRO99_03615, partial [Candidatus Aenigmatarchaeota archaeon]